MTSGDAALPDGWQRLPLLDVCASIQAGPGGGRAQDRGRAPDGGGVPVVLPRDLHGRRIVRGDAEATPVIPWERARTLEKYYLVEGDVLLTRTGTVGRCALVTAEHAGWLPHPNLVRLRLSPAGPVRAAYLTAYLSSTATQEWIRSRAVNSVIPSLSTRVLGELPVLVPPGAEQERIGAVLAALDDKIRAHTEIVRATSEYRDALADALLTGALRADRDPGARF
ncbi:restriction endonuclease subunit S [Streptomyces echinoruber]|uniref:Type I restriction modification DNA specificity domain-containing protein n=1 Tax=Streptomyces echinoruber TaxID=68898 RepID=A0A918VN46_9ACTN|nr:restriction endonuclease subunit S [Streptomyces echinoruber]GHA09240.1 hypothetical protein GCM10010389_55410 [Streptomyces echinoruber]